MGLVQLFDQFLGRFDFWMDRLLSPIPVVVVGNLVFSPGTTLHIIDVHDGNNADPRILS